jgi:hypothetical protein
LVLEDAAELDAIQPWRGFTSLDDFDAARLAEFR